METKSHSWEKTKACPGADLGEVRESEVLAGSWWPMLKAQANGRTIGPD
jgi:hypothetical protein